MAGNDDDTDGEIGSEIGSKGPDATADATDAAAAEAEADADARALASVLRFRILRLCLDEPLTNKEIAQRLGKDPGTVLHHVRRLVDRDFLAAQPARRGARGAKEIPYLATGKSFRTPLPGAANLLVRTFLEEFEEFAAAGDLEAAVMGRLGLRLGAADHEELRRRIRDLLDEFAERAPDQDGVPYSLFVALHEDVARRRPHRAG